MMLWLLAVLWTSIMKLGVVEGVELTFELPDNAKECFHEIIEKDTESTLEFQVFYYQTALVWNGAHYWFHLLLIQEFVNKMWKQIHNVDVFMQVILSTTSTLRWSLVDITTWT